MRNDPSELQWEKLGRFVADRLGLSFQPLRQNDLRRGFESASQEFGFADVTTCMEWLWSTPPTGVQLQILASHLTIGETYFFREKQTLEALAKTILPALIHSCRGHTQQLRIWSAACCSGEEAYSLAILLHRALPDLETWQVTITGTDINPHFLQKASAGIYSKWSFRGVPAWLKEGYFNITPDGDYAIIPAIKKLVTFRALNLADDVYPSSSVDVSKMDIIFCRNVLMYFTPELIPKVIENLHKSLNAGGWLAVSPCEATRASFPQFRTVHFPGAILFQKEGSPVLTETKSEAGGSSSTSLRPAMVSGTYLPSTVAPADQHVFVSSNKPDLRGRNTASPADIGLLPDKTSYASRSARWTPQDAHDAQDPGGVEEVSRFAWALANQGKPTDALAWCDRWIAIDKLSPPAYYLRAVILQEQGNLEDAHTALERAVYLDQEFVLAHFALGNVAQRDGKHSEARRHFANTRHLLRHYRPGDLLPEAEGMSASGLAEILSSIEEFGATP